MNEQKMLTGLSLAEKQMLYFNGSHCPYCGNESEYVDSIKVYRQSYGMIYYCQPCAAWVNCHHGEDQAFGSLAKGNLRDLRHQTHLIFDPLWQMKVDTGKSKRKPAQASARKWLASELKIEIEEAHIGMFDIEHCQKTIELCKAVHEDLKEKAIIREEITQKRVGAFIFQCARLGLNYKDFLINGSLKYEMHTKNGRFFRYWPSKGNAQFDNGKIFLIEDIETFITEHFKTEKNGK